MAVKSPSSFQRMTPVFLSTRGLAISPEEAGHALTLLLVSTATPTVCASLAIPSGTG